MFLPEVNKLTLTDSFSSTVAILAITVRPRSLHRYALMIASGLARGRLRPAMNKTGKPAAIKAKNSGSPRLGGGKAVIDSDSGLMRCTSSRNGSCSSAVLYE